MPEAQQMTFDEAGVTRTPTGTIADQSPGSSTLNSTTSQPQPAETIVRPPPTPTKEATTITQSKETKPETKADGKAETKTPSEAPKSLLNEKGPSQGAPDKYQDFTVPEGFELDKDVAAEFGTIAKGLNISQTGAQELVDLYVKHVQEANDAPYKVWKNIQDQWKNEINNDTEIGGSKLSGVKVSIGKLFDSLGDAKVTDAFRDAMDYTGAGNNPAVIRFLYSLAKRLTEGGPVRGGGPSTEGQIAPGTGRMPSAASAIYPNLPSNQR